MFASHKISKIVIMIKLKKGIFFLKKDKFLEKIFAVQTIAIPFGIQRNPLVKTEKKAIIFNQCLKSLFSSQVESEN